MEPAQPRTKSLISAPRIRPWVRGWKPAMTALYETELSPQTFYGTERNGTDTFFARGHITAGNNNP